MSSTGGRILASLKEVQSWIHGESTLRVHIPGEEPRDMTFAEVVVTEEARRPKARQGEPILMDRARFESLTDRSGWPFWCGFDRTTGRSVMVATGGGIVRVVLGGEQIYRHDETYERDNLPDWETIARFCNVTVGD